MTSNTKEHDLAGCCAMGLCGPERAQAVRDQTANDNYALYELDRVAKAKAQPKLPSVTGERTAARKPLFACQECGKKFYTTQSADRAAFGDNGCPKCGGSDIDIYVPAERPRDEYEFDSIHGRSANI